MYHKMSDFYSKELIEACKPYENVKFEEEEWEEESQPTADVKPVVHGKWEKNEHTFLTCNKCGFVNKYNRMQYAYCPNCGADMRGGEK